MINKKEKKKMTLDDLKNNINILINKEEKDIYLIKKELNDYLNEIKNNINLLKEFLKYLYELLEKGIDVQHIIDEVEDIINSLEDKLEDKQKGPKGPKFK